MTFWRTNSLITISHNCDVTFPDLTFTIDVFSGEPVILSDISANFIRSETDVKPIQLELIYLEKIKLLQQKSVLTTLPKTVKFRPVTWKVTFIIFGLIYLAICMSHFPLQKVKPSLRHQNGTQLKIENNPQPKDNYPTVLFTLKVEGRV